MITDTIKQQIQKAMKEKDEIRLSTLKMLSAALTNAEIDKKREKLTEEDELKVVKSEAKKRKDAIEIYEKSQDSKTQKLQEKITREKQELEVLSEFLPEEMSDEYLENIVSDTINQMGASSMADMGKVMGVVMGKIKGQADGNRVSALVRSKLT